MRNATMSRMGTPGTHWRPMPRRHPQMMGNIHRLGGAQLGFAFTAGTLLWGVARYVGLPLLVGAGVFAATGAIAKTVVPDIGITTDRIPHAALLGGAGVAAYYAGGLLPSGWEPVAYIAAVAGVSASVYWLFSGKPASPGPRNETANPLPPYNIHDILEITFDPGQPNTGRTSRYTWLTQDYEFFIENKTDTQQDFFVGLRVTEHGTGRKIYASDPKEKDPVYGRREVKLPARGEIPVTVSHTELRDSGEHDVTVEIFRTRYAKDPALTKSIAIDYSRVQLTPILW